MERLSRNPGTCWLVLIRKRGRGKEEVEQVKRGCPDKVRERETLPVKRALHFAPSSESHSEGIGDCNLSSRVLQQATVTVIK